MLKVKLNEFSESVSYIFKPHLNNSIKHVLKSVPIQPHLTTCLVFRICSGLIHFSCQPLADSGPKTCSSCTFALSSSSPFCTFHSALSSLGLPVPSSDAFSLGR